MLALNRHLKEHVDQLDVTPVSPRLSPSVSVIKTSYKVVLKYRIPPGCTWERTSLKDVDAEVWDGNHTIGYETAIVKDDIRFVCEGAEKTPRRAHQVYRDLSDPSYTGMLT